jgi:hypothetical protein
VKGFIPVEGIFKTNDATVQAGSCQRLASLTALQAIQPQNTSGGLAIGLGTLAQADPAGASPIIPGFTNEQAALFLGTLTFNIFAPDPAPVPLYHFNGGIFDPVTQLPVGLNYTSVPYYYDFLTRAAPFQSLGEQVDSETILCGATDTPYDDHLANVTVPTLYIGAAGGFGATGIYSTTLLGSTDVTTQVVSLQAPTDVLFDYGHADVWMANDAATQVWAPIAAWIQAH